MTESKAAETCAPASGAYGPSYVVSRLSAEKKKVRKTPVATRTT